MLVVLTAFPVSAQYRFAATVNPLPAVGLFFDGWGIGASFEAAPLRNLAFKGTFTTMHLDMARLTDSTTFSEMDTNLLMLGLSARYYFFNTYLAGLFGGLRIRYVASSMENTSKVFGPPPKVKAEFNDILLGAELGYKFIFAVSNRIGLYVEPSCGYDFTVKSGGNYDGSSSQKSYRESIPSEYRNYADRIFGKGFVFGLSIGLAF
jgi:hypothetical protein